MKVAPTPRKTRRGCAARGESGAWREREKAAQARSAVGCCCCGLVRPRRRCDRGARVAIDSSGDDAAVARCRVGE